MKNKCGYNKKDLQLIRNFVKDIDKDILIRIAPNKEFCCCLPLGKIYLGQKKMRGFEIYWYEWYQRQPFYSKEEINVRIISLLHEIGHFATFDMQEWLDRNAEVEKLTERYYNDEISYEELNYAYWNLPNEYKATEWAVNYYKSNKEKCDRLAEMVNFKYVIVKE